MKSIYRINHPIYKYLGVLVALLATALVIYKPVPGRATTVVIDNPLPPVRQPGIQLAILLDTSNSMDGLIDQAKNQLWQIVNEFAQAKKNGVSPSLEVAVYEYGNSNLSVDTGHVRQVTGLTRDLDRVSEALFALTTNGGDEYCGYVIDRAVRELEWNESGDDIKVIFIAGNEPFTQGPVAYRQAVALAAEHGITVNTIHAGDYNEGIRTGWQEGAQLAGGSYMSIDHNHQVVHVAAPQDDRIATLNRQLNSTYIPYGPQGAEGSRRQQEMDDKNKGISRALLAERVQAKASAFYNSEDWDLVDAVGNGKAALDSLAPEALPAEMQAMDDQERKDYVQAKTEERDRLKKEIAVLSQERDEFIAAEQQQQAEPAPATVNEAVTSAIRQQMETKNFKLENK